MGGDGNPQQVGVFLHQALHPLAQAAQPLAQVGVHLGEVARVFLKSLEKGLEGAA